MPITRREFLKNSGLLGVALTAASMRAFIRPAPKFRPTLNTDSLARFVDPLPIPSIARAIGHRKTPTGAEVPFYRVEMRACESRLHRDLNPTQMWGYGSTFPGPTFETKSGEGILVEWINALPNAHVFPIDHKLHGAERNLPEVRTVVHVHGAKTPPDSDGYPESWYPSGKSALAWYPNRQDAAMLWYHDHAMGINRLNIYAGLAGLFIVRDDAEAALNLPSGKFEIPLVLCDRLLDRDHQLYYPDSGIPGAPWIPEVYGNVILANGKIFPYLDVEPRMYRVRVLNAANSRFFSLSLGSGGSFHQIGTDLGLLPAPVELKSLLLYPAERADLIFDFSGHAGERIELKHQAMEVMQFRVADEPAKETGVMPARMRPVAKLAESAAVTTRMLTLVEYDDYVGNSMVMLLNGSHWSDPVTEQPILDSVEIWNLINLTEDAHPIHLHLVRFQILDRRPFDVFAYQQNRTIRYLGPATPPDPNEAGWKDTVRADPGLVTRIIARFEGFAGRYVWHCHLLEHEDNEMMRPYEVVTSASERVAAITAQEASWCIGGNIVRR
ncbi:multicopper oxidase family protein [Candidatus Binatus sp.]|uniref:multicopper oxidase family protein n=1 Tax=Candidatus Binatus sp. TaxID=2811406 RepID=UPI003C8B6D4C